MSSPVASAPETTRDVWSALANPVRRAVLDQLRDGPRTTGDLVAAFPHLSRFAVMQHLSVLEDAGLLLARRRGRHRENHLNVAPLQEVRQRWLSEFGESAGRVASALKHHIETRPQKPQPRTDEENTDMSVIETQNQPRARAVRTESEFRVDAPIARVFVALTEEQHDWYPYTYGGERVRSIVFEPRVGGGCFEDWGDGAGHYYGVVTHYEPPVAVTIRGGLAGGTVLENAFVLTEQDGSTTVRHSMTAFGDLSDDDVTGIRTHGDMSAFEPQLRAWVERGERVR